jgi:hypothetical protein
MQNLWFYRFCHQHYCGTKISIPCQAPFHMHLDPPISSTINSTACRRRFLYLVLLSRCLDHAVKMWHALYWGNWKISLRTRFGEHWCMCSHLAIRSFSSDYEYEICQAKRMLYAYAIPYWREKVVAVAHLGTKLWRNLVVRTTTFQKNFSKSRC